MTCFSWLDKHFCALLIMLVRGYQLTLSPWLGRGCRFTPSCSQYCIDALRQRGFMTGHMADRETADALSTLVRGRL